MTEVDEIVEALAAPVNSWLNGEQQLKFARLVVIAKQNAESTHNWLAASVRADKAEKELREFQQAIEQEREDIIRWSAPE